MFLAKMVKCAVNNAEIRLKQENKLDKLHLGHIRTFENSDLPKLWTQKVLTTSQFALQLNLKITKCSLSVCLPTPLYISSSNTQK